MAKDDYDVIVFKILVYLYAVMKRKVVFNDTSFYHAIGKKSIDDGYFIDILWMMNQEKMIDGLEFQVAWGQERILLNKLSDMFITSIGIHYLNENNRMKKVKNILIDNVDIIASLIDLVI